VTDEQINEFRTWLENHISINNAVSQNPNISKDIRVFRLGGALALEVALKEFNRVFTSEDKNEGA